MWCEVKPRALQDEAWVQPAEERDGQYLQSWCFYVYYKNLCVITTCQVCKRTRVIKKYHGGSHTCI